jgi:O-acetyl-ADP-ribose deacetylase (regulator of RNase III)
MPRNTEPYNCGRGAIELVNSRLQGIDYVSQATVCPIGDDMSAYAEGTVFMSIPPAQRDKISDRLHYLKPRLTERKLELGRAYPLLLGDLFGNLSAYTILAVTTHRDERAVVPSSHQTSKNIIADATTNSLIIASIIGISSIAFPLLGAGQGRLPLEDSLNAMTSQISVHFASPSSLTLVSIAVPDVTNFDRAKAFLDQKLR